MVRRSCFLLVAFALIGCNDVSKETSGPTDPPAPQQQAGNPAPEQPADAAKGGQLLAGVAKVDITNTKAGPVNDPLYVKALVLKNGSTTTVLVTLDAVAIAEIGYIKNDYLGNVRSRLQKELQIDPAHVLVNASHCHGVVGSDVDQKTFQAVKEAAQKMAPVTVGVGIGNENRVMENR